MHHFHDYDKLIYFEKIVIFPTNPAQIEKKMKWRKNTNDSFTSWACIDIN